MISLHNIKFIEVMEKKRKESKVTIGCHYDAISIAFICLLSLLIIACNSPFSKYEKKGKNDLEKARLHGKVKQVIKSCLAVVRKN